MANVSDNQQERPLVGGKDFVTCQICGYKGETLAHHLYKHNLIGKEYHKRFPGWKTVCDNIKHQREATWVRNFGVKYPMQNSVIQKKQQEKREKTCLERYGVSNVFYSPELQKTFYTKGKAAFREKYGVENPGQLDWVQIKIRQKAAQAPNGVETLVASMLPKYVKYTGDGKFWIRLKDGSPKNPDFVVRPFRKWRKVIEVFGSFFHKEGEDIELTNKYREVRVSCLVLWDGNEQHNRTKAWQEETKKKINLFLEESPETVR